MHDQPDPPSGSPTRSDRFWLTCARTRWRSVVLLIVLFASACAAEVEDPSFALLPVDAVESSVEPVTPAVDTETAAGHTRAEAQPAPADPGFAWLNDDESLEGLDEPVELGTALPSAPVGFEALSQGFDDDGPQPVGLTIEAIEVAEARVIPVGINAEDASMEIPPAEDVGWYRFGALPGGDGSAVLAAHIAYDGRDGVFRRLSELEPGSVVVVAFDDGSSQRWAIDEVIDYEKTELPDELFAVTGEPRLTLITCGGAFNPSLRSYESNTVAIARQL